MKFLKDLNKKDGEGKPPVIEIKRQITINGTCESCDYMGKMEGGETESGKAVFMCPKCNALLWIKWGNIG